MALFLCRHMTPGAPRRASEGSCRCEPVGTRPRSQEWGKAAREGGRHPGGLGRYLHCPYGGVDKPRVLCLSAQASCFTCTRRQPQVLDPSLPKVMISDPRKELCLPEHLISSVRGLFIKAPALLPQVSLATIVSQAHPEIREVSLPWLVHGWFD